MARYWDCNIQDKAIIAYRLSTDEYDRNYLWNEYLHKPFDKMAECIINTFKKNSYILEHYRNLKKHLVSKCLFEFDKWLPEKGNAFSYFSIVMKYEMINMNMSGYKEYIRNLSSHSKDDDDKDNLDMVEKIYDEVSVEEMKNENSYCESTENIMIIYNFFKDNVDKIFTSTKQIEVVKVIFDVSTPETISKLNDKLQLQQLRKMIKDECAKRNISISEVYLKMCLRYIKDNYRKLLTDNGKCDDVTKYLRRQLKKNLTQ